MREAFYAALLAIGTVALFPLLLVAALLGMGLAIAFVIGLAGDHGCGGIHVFGEAAVGVGRYLTPGYYRLLLRQRHPVVLGIALGATLGCLSLGLLLALIVFPKEARTTETLAAMKQEITTSGRIPSPDAQGHLQLSGTAVIQDGFGRPMEYEEEGLVFKSWRLRSLGYDGTRSSDDLCISGESTLSEWASHVRYAVDTLNELRPNTLRVGEQLQGITSLRCATP